MAGDLDARTAAIEQLVRSHMADGFTIANTREASLGAPDSLIGKCSCACATTARSEPLGT